MAAPGKTLVCVVFCAAPHTSRLFLMMAANPTHPSVLKLPPFLPPHVRVSLSLRVLLQTAQRRQISNLAQASERWPLIQYRHAYLTTYLVEDTIRQKIQIN